MTNAMKEVAMDLLFGDAFPILKKIPDDPEYLEIICEMTILLRKIYDTMSDNECEKIAELLALKDMAQGYQLIEYFHEGLMEGFLLRDKIRGNANEKEIINLIFN